MIHIWLIPFSIQKRIRIMIFIDVVKSKWAIILNCQHIIKYESGKRVQSCSRLEGECKTEPRGDSRRYPAGAASPLGWVGGRGKTQGAAESHRWRSWVFVMPFNAGVTLQLSSGQYSVFLRYREFGIIAKRLFAVPGKGTMYVGWSPQGGWEKQRSAF